MKNILSRIAVRLWWTLIAVLVLSVLWGSSYLLGILFGTPLHFDKIDAFLILFPLMLGWTVQKR